MITVNQGSVGVASSVEVLNWINCLKCKNKYFENIFQPRVFLSYTFAFETVLGNLLLEDVERF